MSRVTSEGCLSAAVSGYDDLLQLHVYRSPLRCSHTAHGRRASRERIADSLNMKTVRISFSFWYK